MFYIIPFDIPVAFQKISQPPADIFSNSISVHTLRKTMKLVARKPIHGSVKQQAGGIITGVQTRSAKLCISGSTRKPLSQLPEGVHSSTRSKQVAFPAIPAKDVLLSESVMSDKAVKRRLAVRNDAHVVTSTVDNAKPIIPCNRSYYTKLIQDPQSSFKLPRLSCYYRGVWSAKYKERKIFIKTAVFCEVEKVKLLKNEVKIYNALECLQGDTIPILIYSGWVHGSMTLILSDCGTDVDDLGEENVTEPVLQSCAAAVRSLHDRGILHGDLAERNLAIDRRGKVRIFDFGYSSLKPSKQRLAEEKEQAYWWFSAPPDSSEKL